MDFIMTNDLGHKLTAQVIKINNDVMKDLYVHFKWYCIYCSGYCPDFTLSNVDNIGPRLIPVKSYKLDMKELNRLHEKLCDMGLSFDVDPVVLNDTKERIKVAQANVNRIEKLCDGFGYDVYTWLRCYGIDNEQAKKVFIEKANDIAPSDCEVFHFRNFLSDCANYVGFYFMQVTDPQFCDDVLEHFQKLIPKQSSKNSLCYMDYRRFVYDLIMCASMLYKCANRFGKVKYDGPDLVDEHKSFKVEAGDPKYPKGLYSTNIAQKVFEAIR